jgi:hypothetical protein
MMKTAVRRAITLGVLSLTLLSIGPTAAAAVAGSAPTTTSAPVVMSPLYSESISANPLLTAGVAPMRLDENGNSYTGSASEMLTTNRWQLGSSIFHGRFDQFLQTDVITYSQRTISQATGMMVGNGMYAVTQGVLDFSLTLEPLNLLGAQADAVAKTIGEALLSNSPVVLGLVVLIIFGVIFSMARSQNRPWKRLLSVVGVVALFAVMIAGASASTGGTDGEDYRPGLLSPGWFATSINDSITIIASVPAEALVIANPVEGATSPEGTGCYTYTENLGAQYEAGSGGNAIPRIIASLWDSTGLSVWKQTQYGSYPYDEVTGATYGDEAYCHQLDWQSNGSVSAQASTTFGSLGAAEAANYSPDSSAWGDDNNNRRDQSLIAWAACENDGNGNFSIRGGFAKEKDGTTSWITPNHCDKWWTGDRGTNLDAFNVGGKSSDVTAHTDDPAIINFIQTLHGNDTNAGLLLIWTYGISAFMIMLVFGGLGIAIVIAKFAGVVMIVSVFFVLLMSLLAKQDMGNKMMQYLKTYIGFSVFAFGATLILAMVTILSQMISGTGNAVFGQGSIMALIWTGASPIIACWLLHLIFTKFFKMPSVFKPSSALAWGAAGGAVGGAIGQSLARREGRATSMVKNMANLAGSRAGHYAMGGLRSATSRGGRQGMMAPGVGGSALGGAAFAAGASVVNKRNKNSESDEASAAMLAEAKSFAKGPRSEAVTGSRLDRAAAAGGRFTRGALDKISAGRERAQAVTSPAYRAELRAKGGKAISSATAKMKSTGEWIHDDPIGAAGFMAENAGRSMRDAARGGGRAAVSGVRAGQRAVSGPGAQAAARSIGKVGLGAVVGTIIAGPVGGVAGAAIGAGRARATLTGAREGRDAKLISDYLEHKNNTQADTANEPEAPRRDSNGA